LERVEGTRLPALLATKLVDKKPKKPQYKSYKQINTWKGQQAQAQVNQVADPRKKGTGI
jgi:hypothetical protein